MSTLPLFPMALSDVVLLRSRAQKALDAGDDCSSLIGGGDGHVYPAVTVRASHVLQVLDRNEKAEAEIALWRKGNPSDDLWRVRMEQAEAALDEQKAELLRVVTALHGADASLREHMAWVSKLRTALRWARACLPLSCLGNKNGSGATLGDAIDAALRGGE